jgi:hypothetical protein
MVAVVLAGRMIRDDDIANLCGDVMCHDGQEIILLVNVVCR